MTIILAFLATGLRWQHGFRNQTRIGAIFA
jgi:hypothetical protein